MFEKHKLSAKLFLFMLAGIINLNAHATSHTILVWSGYYKFLKGSDMSDLAQNPLVIQLGDTIDFLPLDPPSMMHTITSAGIPAGAVPFDVMWQLPADTFFQYVPLVAGSYDIQCTPHISLGMIGSFTVTAPNVGITEVNPKYNLSVFPNPFSGPTAFQSSADLLGELFVIVDSHGYPIASTKITATNTTLDLSHLMSGMYFVHFPSRPELTQKLIKK